MANIFILLIFIISNACYADNISIVTSTTHVASIIDMITKGSVDMNVISNSNSCPEHYTLKPSDIEKVKKADLIIYIDEKFEPFMQHLLSMSKKDFIKISKTPGLYIKDNNLHIWLDLYNTELILNYIYKKLIALAPDQKEIWEANLIASKKSLKRLAFHKNASFRKLHNVFLLSDSLEYLFHNTDIPTQKLYIYPGKISVKTISKLLAISEATYFLGSSNENWTDLEKKIGQKIISVDSEKWDLDYVKHYITIIDNIKIHKNASKSI